MVKWTLPAKKDLRKIHDYIAEDSRFYARRVVENIVEKTEDLDAHPEIGRVVPELNDQSIRELIVYSYRLVYSLKGEAVEILAVVHGKRDFFHVYQK